MSGARRCSAVLWFGLLAGCAGGVPASEATDAARAVLAERHPSAAVRIEAARALWRAGQRSSAAWRYLEALLGPAPPEVMIEAARRVAADAALPVEGELLARLPARDLSALPLELRARVLHRVALELIRAARFEAADAMLAGLVDDPAAHYLRAVLRLRGGDRGGARAELESAERLGGADALVRLGLARLDAAAGDLEQAARRYAAVPPVSPEFFRARQELAWVELERGAPGAALAESAVLQAPAWRHFYRADRELVEAAGLMGLCRDRAARVRARVGLQRLAADLAQLSDFLRARPDVRLYYVEAVTSAAGRGPLPPQIGGALLGDASFFRAFGLVRQLQRERRALLAPGAAGLRDALGDELDRRLVVAQRRAGELTRRLLEELRRELVELSSRLEELLFDLDGRLEQELVARRAGRPAAASAPENRPTVAVGRQQRWPLQGEYWLDEQRDFVVGLSSSCPSGSPRP